MEINIINLSIIRLDLEQNIAMNSIKNIITFKETIFFGTK